jgi:hypothetical protein
MDDFEERMWMTTISYVDGFYLGERVSEVEWRTWVVQLGVRNALMGFYQRGTCDTKRTVVGMKKVGEGRWLGWRRWQVRRTFDQVAQLI